MDNMTMMMRVRETRRMAPMLMEITVAAIIINHMTRVMTMMAMVREVENRSRQYGDTC